MTTIDPYGDKACCALGTNVITRIDDAGETRWLACDEHAGKAARRATRYAPISGAVTVQIESIAEARLCECAHRHHGGSMCERQHDSSQLDTGICPECVQAGHLGDTRAL